MAFLTHVALKMRAVYKVGEIPAPAVLRMQ